jgi:hypothetical protein
LLLEADGESEDANEDASDGVRGGQHVDGRVHVTAQGLGSADGVSQGQNKRDTSHSGGGESHVVRDCDEGQRGSHAGQRQALKRLLMSVSANAFAAAGVACASVPQGDSASTRRTALMGPMVPAQTGQEVQMPRAGLAGRMVRTTRTA